MFSVIDEYNNLYESNKNMFEYNLQLLVGKVANNEDHKDLFDLLVKNYNSMADSNLNMLNLTISNKAEFVTSL